MNNQFIKGNSINWNNISRNSYIHDIDALKSLRYLNLNQSITFLVGENGSGKSTLLEALAVAQKHFRQEGLYILDEPEAALSPQRQLTLLMEIEWNFLGKYTDDGI